MWYSISCFSKHNQEVGENKAQSELEINESIGFEQTKALRLQKVYIKEDHSLIRKVFLNSDI